MASDRKQFAAAMRQWDQMHEDGSYGAPVEYGTTAIIASAFTDDEPTTPAGTNELIAFRAEALDLEQRVRLAGGSTLVAIDATRGDIESIIKDPSVANIYLIGNGTMSAVILGEDDNRFDWNDTVNAADHLKSGFFEQRICGGLLRSLNVPVGLFAMQSHRSVIAATGMEFYPMSLEDPENVKLKPVFETDRVSYEDVKALTDKPAVHVPALEGDFDVVKRAHNIATKVNMGDTVANGNVKLALGNFLLRFVEIEAIRAERGTRSSRIYYNMFRERFGFDMLAFYDDNIAVCNDIAELGKGLLLLGYAEYECNELNIDDTLQPGLPHEEIKRDITLRANQLMEEVYELLNEKILNAPYLTK
ncbi:MAG TPA: hypothetical protein PKD15_03900 [Candidatus Saccharibacteria bacterium]|nr:hypothetical protein [Candidatus Saccharibacteria bacterium]